MHLQSLTVCQRVWHCDLMADSATVPTRVQLVRERVVAHIYHAVLSRESHAKSACIGRLIVTQLEGDEQLELQTPDPKATLRQIFEKRVPQYQLADIAVRSQAGLSIEDMVDRVIAALRTRPDVLEVL